MIDSLVPVGGWLGTRLGSRIAVTLVLCWVIGAIGMDWILEQPVEIAYDPRLQAAPAGIQPADPARLVDAWLRRSGRLPPSGAQLVRRQGVVDWETLPPTALPIAAINLQRVWLVSDESLERTLRDDDPSFGAIVEVLVTTTTGQQVRLRVHLRIAGRLTPWLVTTSGDGWQPGLVEWFPVARAS